MRFAWRPARSFERRTGVFVGPIGPSRSIARRASRPASPQLAKISLAVFTAQSKTENVERVANLDTCPLSNDRFR